MSARDPIVAAALADLRAIIVDGARLAARWFTDPAGAMEHALACIRAEHALDREVAA